ncbi:hypothetical protein Syn1_002 [Prochlorococcus phage Syn1]|uniref:Uncharacterized protein n=1 Tax=Prochlorococcus phage Syn1 TaxID=444861 RepID=E3SP88_9CAUD|nr:hypothetical protein Syn1_002 [Prochlorococcus phage Syn1]ADO99104.1 hypothetical protein Syn1_002 [Prochlorococcus phage Syn1]
MAQGVATNPNPCYNNHVGQHSIKRKTQRKPYLTNLTCHFQI